MKFEEVHSGENKFKKNVENLCFLLFFPSLITAESSLRKPGRKQLFFKSFSPTTDLTIDIDLNTFSR